MKTVDLLQSIMGGILTRHVAFTLKVQNSAARAFVEQEKK